MDLSEYPELIKCIDGINTDIVRSFIKIGNRLFSIKATIPHGEWTPFIKEHFKLSIRSCQDYMYLAKHPIQEKYYSLGKDTLLSRLRAGDDLSI